MIQQSHVTTRNLIIILTLLSAMKSLGQVNDATRILLQKREIDNQVQSNKANLIVFVKIKGQPVPQRIISEQWSENIESTFNILRNKFDQIIYFGEFPKSESGDWVLELKHYFNDKGQTISIEKRLTFLNEDCGEGPITETVDYLYVNNFKLYATLKLPVLDSKGNPVKDVHCSDPYNWPFEKKGTAQELITLKKIKI